MSLDLTHPDYVLLGEKPNQIPAGKFLPLNELGEPIDLNELFLQLKNQVSQSGATPATTPFAGTLAATTTAQVLGSQVCSEVVIQNDPDNAVDILIGTATSQPIQLTPGQPIVVRMANLNLIYIKTVSSTATVGYWGA